MIAPPPHPSQKPATHRHRAGHMRAAGLIVSFHYAFAGVRYLLWTQRNAKIHTAIGLSAVRMAIVLGIDRYEWLALLLTITIVIAAEGVNTALEAVVDLVSPEYHPLAKVAKDVGAGTVLITAFASVIVGMVLFLPRLWSIVLAWLR